MTTTTSTTTAGAPAVHEAEAALRFAVAAEGRHYLRLSTAVNDRAHAAPQAPATGRMTLLRKGLRGTVVAVGPMLDAVLAGVDGLDVTVLYASTVRPFDVAALVATLARPRVVLVEPYLAGTSVGEVSRALAHVPHTVVGHGVGRAELRRYGSPAEHGRAHGLDAAGVRAVVGAALAGGA